MKEVRAINIGLSGSQESPRFRSTDHLSTEAVAAFVDGELSETADQRARTHLVDCGECRREVRIQRVAAERLRSSKGDPSIRAPQNLLERLNQVQNVCEADSRESARSKGEAVIGEVADLVGTALRSIKRRG